MNRMEQDLQQIRISVAVRHDCMMGTFGTSEQIQHSWMLNLAMLKWGVQVGKGVVLCNLPTCTVLRVLCYAIEDSYQM